MLLNEACRLAHRVGGYSFAFVALIDPGAVSRGRSRGPVRTCRTCYDVVFTVGESDTSVTSTRVAHGRSDDQRGSCREAGMFEPTDTIFAVSTQAFACLPLKVDGTTVGALMFGASSGTEHGARRSCAAGEVAVEPFLRASVSRQAGRGAIPAPTSIHHRARKRSLFCERVGRALVPGDTMPPRPSVVVFDVAQHERLERRVGRHVGDLLLQCVADRLKVRLDGTDRVAHLGGGTFAAFCTTRAATSYATSRTRCGAVLRAIPDPGAADPRHRAFQAWPRIPRTERTPQRWSRTPKLR